jgi:hypothetical protein
MWSIDGCIDVKAFSVEKTIETAERYSLIDGKHKKTSIEACSWRSDRV